MTTVLPVVRLGTAWPTASTPHPTTGWRMPLNRVALPGGRAIAISSWGDAVPGGYNGGFLATDTASGAKMGRIEYQSETHGTRTLIAWIETDSKFRGSGVSDALLMRLVAECPGEVIDPGMMTPDGVRWWKRVSKGLPVGSRPGRR